MGGGRASRLTAICPNVKKAPKTSLVLPGDTDPHISDM